MSLSDLAIRRPVFMTMITAALLVIGLLGLNRMQMELYPSVDFPFILVNTVYPGAGPEQVETQISTKIEEAVNAISGINRIQSISQEALSQVILEFELDVNSEVAAQDVREKVETIKALLPEEAEDPVVLRFDPGALPIMSMVVASESMDPQTLTEYIKKNIKPQLETTQGVGQIELLGGSERQINIKIDLQKLTGYGLSIQDVGQKIQAGNLEFPGGRIDEGEREILIRTAGRTQNLDALANLTIKNIGTQFVRLKDIAEVEDGNKEQRSYSAYDGNVAIGISVIKQSDANTVDVADGVKKALVGLTELAKSNGVDITIVDDTSINIKNSVHEVEFDIVLGGILAVVIIFFFLANLPSTFIAALAIPTSIIATFGFMYFFGFTLNFMTLLALSLSVGILVDDAIVVIENIYRHLDEGESRVEAASKGTRQIALAVLATTLSIVAVFIPVATMEGIVGRFFFSFGITVSIAVIISLFVALTLTPMLSARILSKETHLTPQSPWYMLPFYYFNAFFGKVAEWYKGTLKWALTHKILTLIIATLAFFASFFVAGQLGSEFIPAQDQSKFYVNLKAPPGTSMKKTIELVSEVESKLKDYPEVEHTYVTIGRQNAPVNNASILVLLKPKSVRKEAGELDVFNFMVQARNELKDIPGVFLWYGQPSDFGPTQKQMLVSIQGPDLEVSKQLSAEVLEIYRSIDGLVDIETSLEETKPEIQIELKRDAATEAGVNVLTIASTIQQLVDGVKVSDFQSGDQQYDIRLRLKEEDRDDINTLSNILIKTTKKDAAGDFIFVPLSSVAMVKEGYGPSKINRYNRQREIQVGANFAGILLGDATSAIMSKVSEMDIPPGYKIIPIGASDTQAESFGYIFTALLLSIIFVYLILASQFESFSHPISIMVSLPLSLVGAFFGLLVFNSSVSIMSLIGVIMLFGLVTKNAILMVDFTNQLRAEGYSRFDALMKAGPIRLRPILMTTFAMIFGMLPVAFGTGEGAETRAPMGQAIIGGLITSTLLTLLVVPVVYSVLDGFGNWVSRLLGRDKMKLESEPTRGLIDQPQED